MKKLSITALGLITTLFSCATNGNKNKENTTVDAKITENIIYKVVNDTTNLLMDIYTPKNVSNKSLPAVMYIHGGGWQTGNKSKVYNELHLKTTENFLKKGIAVVAINYRLIKPDNGVYLSDCISDAKDALAFLNSEGAKYGIDGKRVIAWGGSAGGHLSMMSGYSDLEDFPGDKILLSKRVKPFAVISWYGSGTFEIKESDTLENVMKKYEVLHKRFTPSDDWNTRREIALKVSPVEYIDSNDPHTLIMNGEEDAGVNIWQAYNTKRILDKHSVKSKLVTVKNAGHTWIGEDISPSKEEIFAITAEYAAKEFGLE